MTITIDTLHGCVDCLTLVANDEVSDSDGNDVTAEHAAKVIAHLGIPRVLTHLVVACEQYCEGWFSWSPCQVCGSSFGGDRHLIALMGAEESGS